MLLRYKNYAIFKPIFLEREVQKKLGGVVRAFRLFGVFSRPLKRGNAPEGGVRDVAQPGSALAWGARGRWFESSRPDNYQSQSGQRAR